MVAAVLDAGALQIYAARGSDPWSLSATITSDTVGSLADVDIATDGRGWLLAWSYRRDDGAYGIRRVQADVLGAPLAFRWIIERALNKPSVSVDGVANATAASGTRYLIAVDRTIESAGGPLSGILAVEVYDATVVTWSISDSLTATSEAPQAQLAPDGSAAVGFTARDLATQKRTLKLATRGPRPAGGDPQAFLPAVPVADGDTGATTGVWALAMNDEVPSHASVAWSRALNAQTESVNYARFATATGAVSLRAPARAAAKVRSIALATGSETVDVLTWVDQPTFSVNTEEPYTVYAQVTAWELRQHAFRAVTSDRTLNLAAAALGMDERQRLFLAISSATGNRIGRLDVWESIASCINCVWPQATTTTVNIPADKVLVNDPQVVVPASRATYPRVLWMRSVGAAFGVFSTQQQVIPPRVPGAPTDVTASSGDGSAIISWTPPADPGSSPIIGYTATAAPGGARCNADAGETECTLSGLTNGTTYTVTVVATNATGSGGASIPSEPFTPGGQVTRPEPPTDLVAKAKKRGRVVLTWSASATPQVTGYVVRIKKGSAAWRPRDVGNVLTKTYTKVKPGTRACYRVAAVDDTGVKSRWTAKVCVVAKR
jgi:hypothetical protein